MSSGSCIWSSQEIPVTVRIIQYADGGQMHPSLQQNAEGWFITDLFEGTSRGYGQQEVPARIILEELSLNGFGILARYPDLFSIECQTKNNALRRVWQPVNEQALLETISGNRQFAKLRNLYFSQFVQTVMASPEGALIRCDYSHAVSRSTPERSVEITVAAGEDWLDRAALEALFSEALNREEPVPLPSDLWQDTDQMVEWPSDLPCG